MLSEAETAAVEAARLQDLLSETREALDAANKVWGGGIGDVPQGWRACRAQALRRPAGC
jgi:hypothetical protein